MIINLFSRFSYFINDFKLYLILDVVSVFICLYLLLKIIKSKLPEINKKILSTFIFSLVLIILTFSVFEGYFRYVYDESDGLGFLKVNKKWQERHVVYNAYFYRDRDFTIEKKEGVTRIGVLGDSLTFGAGVKNINNRFSNLLEQKLKEAGKNVEVYNLGVPGIDTQAEIEQYQKVKNLNFDIIIWEYFLNDIQPEGKSTGAGILNVNSHTDKIIKSISEISYFFNFMYWRLTPKYQSTYEQLKNADLKQYSNEEILTEHKNDIKNFISSLTAENKKVVVIIFPLLNFLGPNYPATDIHKMMSDHFSKNGAQVIDLLGDLKDKNPKDLVASQFDSHPNDKVHALAAEKLYNELLNLIN